MKTIKSLAALVLAAFSALPQPLQAQSIDEKVIKQLVPINVQTQETDRQEAIAYPIRNSLKDLNIYLDRNYPNNRLFAQDSASASHQGTANKKSVGL